MLEGLAPTDRSLLDSLAEDDGLFLTPPDTRSNTQRLYIPRSAIAEFQLLAVITTPSRRQPRATNSTSSQLLKRMLEDYEEYLHAITPAKLKESSVISYAGKNSRTVNYLKVLYFDYPQWTPCSIGFLPATWMKYRQSLEDLVPEHPRVFPGFRQGLRGFRSKDDVEPALRTGSAHRLLGHRLEQHRPRPGQPGETRAAGRLAGLRRMEGNACPTR